MEPRLRANPEQFSVLIDFMERHGDLSRPSPGPQGRIKCDHLWQELTNNLNSLGGGVQKSSDKWRKVWADWKTKTKKKYLSQRLQASGTGDGPSNRITLTAMEERVVAVIGGSAVVGQPGIQKQSFNRTSNEPAFEGGRTIELISEHENAIYIELEDHSQNITPLSPAGHTPASPPSSPSSPPRSPSVRNNRRQASASSGSTATSPRRKLLRPRRGATSFERAADQFAAIEERRLEHEEARDKRLHEREMERLRLEAERIDVAREHNLLLHQLSLLGQQLIDVIARQRSNTLPSRHT